MLFGVRYNKIKAREKSNYKLLKVYISTTEVFFLNTILFEFDMGHPLYIIPKYCIFLC